MSFTHRHNARPIYQSFGGYSLDIIYARLISNSAPQSPALRGLKSSPNAPSSPRRLFVQVRRLFIISPSSLLISQPPADLVQDLYLRELKSYKPPQVKASDSEGHVQKFNAPKAPKSPEETDIANELKAYEASTVELEGQAGSEGGAAPIDQDWFEEEPEEDAHAKH